MNSTEKLEQLINRYATLKQENENNIKNPKEDEIRLAIEDEIFNVLKSTRPSSMVYIENNPLIKELLSRKQKQEVNIETASSIQTTKSETESGVKIIDSIQDMTISGGSISLYQSEIINALAKCLRDNEQVTTDGKCFCSIGQIAHWMTGNKHLKQPQIDEITQALESLSEQRIKYTTTADISKFLNLPETASDIAIGKGNEQILQADFFSGKIRNQPATIVIFNFARILTQMFKTLNWYEDMPMELKGVKKIAADGSLKTWNLTKSRIEVRTSLYLFVSSYARAKNSGKLISNKKSYKAIFEECGYDNYEELAWNQKNRKKKDIAVILDWLVYNDVIGGWEEYTNKGNKTPDGIQILGFASFHNQAKEKLFAASDNSNS